MVRELWRFCFKRHLDRPGSFEIIPSEAPWSPTIRLNSDEPRDEQFRRTTSQALISRAYSSEKSGGWLNEFFRPFSE